MRVGVFKNRLFSAQSGSDPTGLPSVIHLNPQRRRLGQVGEGHGFLHVAALGHFQLNDVDVARGLAVVAGDAAVLNMRKLAG
jgi:hypothetical protein